MLVSREKLKPYDIARDLFFARRTGEGMPVSRDAFFLKNPARLLGGIFCAIGNDSDGWQLELYNGINWKTIEPDPNYSLIITTAGLAALTNVRLGGLELHFTGLKIINRIVTDPGIPVISWTDTEFLQAGEVVFSVGTQGSSHIINPNTTKPYLYEILKWRFNTAAGGLQYLVTLPTEGFGSQSDDGKNEWKIGTIGLYIKDPSNNTDDILFAVASLPTLVTKYSTTIERAGNAIELYFNTVLNNLGVVSNIDVIPESVSNMPEVPNESLLLYPTDETKRMHNCYVIDNYNGSGVPALAVAKSMNQVNMNMSDWAFFAPTDNIINVDSDLFDKSVANYSAVYWDTRENKYKLAEGIKEGQPSVDNEKTPIGLRIGNGIIYMGDVANTSVPYQYSVALVTPGSNYAVGDELLLPLDNSLVFKVVIHGVGPNGEIQGAKVSFLGPTAGNTPIEGNSITLNAVYDPRSPLPHGGLGARFNVTATTQPSFSWNFPVSWLNKPLYCDDGKNAGRPTITKTDSLLGWCTGTNSMRLSLDLRNQANFNLYGITRYSTDEEIKEIISHPNADLTSVTPKLLKDNYLQTTKSINPKQTGSTLENPINVQSFCRFNEIVMGKGATAPYNDTNNPHLTDADLSFYGIAYRAKWGDLAEFYRADKVYEPGTLITMGKGEAEISIATSEVNGVISTKPGYQLGNKNSEYDLPVALTGRVPVLFDGNCLPKFGDRIYLSRVKAGCASTVQNGPCLGKVIDKSAGTKQKIECVIRMEF